MNVLSGLGCVPRALLANTAIMFLGGALCGRSVRRQQYPQEISGLAWGIGAVTASTIVINVIDDPLLSALNDKCTASMFKQLSIASSALLGGYLGAQGLIEIMAARIPEIPRSRIFTVIVVGGFLASSAAGGYLGMVLKERGFAILGPGVGYMASLALSAGATFLGALASWRIRRE
jgi:hypothetical protein